MENLLSLEGKAAVITGAGSGIGQQMLKNLLKQVHTSISLILTSDTANETATDIQKEGGFIRVHHGDVADQKRSKKS